MQWKYNELTITVYEGDPEAPLVLMHENQQEGGTVRKLLADTENSCTLACISGIRWEHDLAPWNAPAVFKKGAPFTGGADAHLKVILEQIIPEIERQTGHGFREIYMAGYSLAGLFAVYSSCRTDLFSGFVSASGSLWFPEFMEYTEKHPVSDQVRKAYFSLGDKESRTKNPVMQTVEENTEKLKKRLEEQGIDTVFELNAGGHFSEEELRLAKGIAWILKGGNR